MNFLKPYRRVRTLLYSIILKSCLHSLGPGSRIEGPLRLGGASRISIGCNVFIGSDSWLTAENPEESSHETPAISIGNGTSISGHCTITAAYRIEIGEQVLIGRYVHISDHSHCYNNTEIPIKSQGITTPKPVKIGNGTWLGQNTIICPGVEIGDNCVIGANSIVKNNIPHFSLAAGAPAKIKRNLKGSIGNLMGRG